MALQLTMSEPERALLEKIVSRYYGDLREEIYKTDTSTFKAELKKEEEVVAALLQRLAK